MAAQLCDRIYVMYAGRVLESGPAEEIIERPMHPYTKTLMSSIPHGFYDSPDLPVSQGEPPDLRHLPPPGCPFQPRCPLSFEKCVSMPPDVTVNDRMVKCWLYAR